MKPILRAAPLFVALTVPLRAQSPGRCRHPARSSNDIEACAALRLQRSEASLGRAEATARQVAGPGAAVAFAEGARTWRAYREAECHTIYVSYDGGSGATAALLICKATLTEQRARALRLVYSKEG